MVLAAPTSADAVRYTAPSGARVFSSGSLYFVYGLDNYYGHRDVLPDPRLRQFMRNALADLTVKHSAKHALDARGDGQ